MPFSPALPLARLLEIVRTAKDLMEPWEYFHDELASRPEFMPLGEPGTHPTFERVLEAAASSVLPAAAKLTAPTFIHIAEFGFWHGSAQIGGKTAIAFFYDGHEVGLAGLLDDPEAESVTLMRLSVVPLAGGTPPFPTTDRGEA